MCASMGGGGPGCEPAATTKSGDHCHKPILTFVQAGSSRWNIYGGERGLFFKKKLIIKKGHKLFQYLSTDFPKTVS